MSNDAVKKIAGDVEKITRRSMKEAVAEYVKNKCVEDEAFAEQVLKPKKDMFKCFRFINRKAKDWIEAEAKARGETLSGVQGEDVPDELCYSWAVEYFQTDNLPEDGYKPPNPPAKKDEKKKDVKKPKDNKKAGEEQQQLSLEM